MTPTAHEWLERIATDPPSHGINESYRRKGGDPRDDQGPLLRI